jgi:hypothetical protein
MNLISETYHLCESREYTFIILWSTKELLGIELYLGPTINTKTVVLYVGFGGSKLFVCFYWY